jgi:hypothetical protein
MHYLGNVCQMFSGTSIGEFVNYDVYFEKDCVHEMNRLSSTV